MNVSWAKMGKVIEVLQVAMNDKYKDYFNDEGEFLIPFEDIQRGKRPRQMKALHLHPLRILLLVLFCCITGVLCGFGFILTMIYA